MGSLADFLPQDLKDDFILAVRGLSTFINPRRYMNLMLLETPRVVLLRFLFLGLIFSSIQTIVFSTVSKQNVFLITTMKTVIFDTAFSLSVFPILWLSLTLLKHDHPIKIIIGFIYPLRFLLLIPCVIFYGLFLSTEEYFFIVPRALMFYVYVIAYIFILPICAFNRTGKKLIAFCIILSFNLVHGYLIVEIGEKFESIASSLHKTSILYDPISFEVDENIAIFNDEVSVNSCPTAFKKAIQIINAADPSNIKEPLNKKAMNDLQITWIQEKDRFYRINSILKNSIIEQIARSEFDTTKNLLYQSMNMLDQMQLISSLLDDYIRMPSGKTIVLIYKQYEKLQQLQIKRSSNIISHYKTRVLLKKYYCIW